MKKKLSALLLAAALCLCCAACGLIPGDRPGTPAASSSVQPPAAVLPGEYPMEFIFSSGAGAWRTFLTLNADGTFVGEYTDSDMGDMGDDYPNGTLYLCSFSGRFEILPAADDGTIPLRLVELIREDDVGRIDIKDGIRRIYSEPVGLYVYEEERLAEALILYSPDTPVAELSEEMLYWWPGNFSDPTPNTLECHALWSPESGSAFFAYPEDYNW